MDRFKDAFREEARELLSGLEESLLVLENDPENQEEISSVFRAMHTIKGSSSMFGFDYISSFTHDLENLFDRVRNGEVKVNQGIISAMLSCKDFIEDLLLRDSLDEEGLSEKSTELLEKVFKAAVGKTSSPQPVGVPKQPEVIKKAPPIQEASSRANELLTFRIELNPHEDVFSNGTRPLNLIRELRDLGDVTILPFVGQIPLLSDIEPEKSYLRWTIFLTTTHSLAEVQDVFLFVQDTADIRIDVIDTPTDSHEQEYKLGNILVKKGLISVEHVEEAITRQKKIGEILIDEGVSPQEIRKALGEQEHVRKTREKISSETGANTIRVASDKLDSLVDLVGELVTLQARLTQNIYTEDSAGLQGVSEQLERLTSELRDSTMSIRMLPIGTTFNRFKRLVRDLSQELGKEIEFRTEGGETEVDKTVIERLNDPLVHLIRNSIDHGIERPELRKQQKKDGQGVLTLRAEHVGASVQIIVEDDGKGLDSKTLYDLGVQRGLVVPGAELSDQEIFMLITAPGFSTAAEVTHVSGRGVGMDVVRREIESLGGSLRIQSEKGKGSRMILEIPLTLAIIEGLLVETGKENFVFPLSTVEECIEYRKMDGKASMMEHRGDVLPLCDLRKVLEIPNSGTAEQQVVVVHTNEGPTGIIVDSVIGGHQTVVKNLGKLYRDAEGISGATILGDGSIALILEVNQLVKVAVQNN
ncbi:MAG: chemotaxis protein CheA [Spirochaetales bacterium]|nr:chemotaxis protein CheA [Spirochaetales bacterium]